MKSQLELHEVQEKDLQNQIKDLSRKLDNLEAQVVHRTCRCQCRLETKLVLAADLV